MFTIINRSITLFVFSLLLITSNVLHAMESQTLGKIPLDEGLRGVPPWAVCRPNRFVICKSYQGLNSKDRYVVYDVSGNEISNYDDKSGGCLESMLPLNDVEVMLIDQYGTSVRKLNIETGMFSHMFMLPGIDPVNINSCFIMKKGLMQFTYTDDLEYKIMIFNYEENKIERMLPSIPQDIPFQARGGEKYIFWLTRDHNLLVWDIDAGALIDEMKIPFRVKSSDHDIYCNSMCYTFNHIILGWNDGIISIFNLDTKKQDLEFKAHDGSISSIIEIGKGYYVTAGDDGLVKTWNVSNNKCRHVFDGHKTDNRYGIRRLMLLSSSLVASATEDNIQISRALVREA